MSILPVNYQKWPCLFLSSCLVKLVEIYIEISADDALYVLLKSSFYLSPFMNNTENKVAFSLFSCVFMMVPHMYFFLSNFFSLKHESKGCLVSSLTAFSMLFLVIALFLIQLSSFHRQLNFYCWFQKTLKKYPSPL